MSYQEINKFTRAVTKGMGWRQRSEVKRELRAHILDSADALAAERRMPVDDSIIREVIRKMGPPGEIAAMYPSNKKKSMLDKALDFGIIAILLVIVVVIIFIIWWLTTPGHGAF